MPSGRVFFDALQLLAGEVHFLDSLNPSHIAETIKKERISVALARDVLSEQVLAVLEGVRR